MHYQRSQPPTACTQTSSVCSVTWWLNLMMERQLLLRHVPYYKKKNKELHNDHQIIGFLTILAQIHCILFNLWGMLVLLLNVSSTCVCVSGGMSSDFQVLFPLFRWRRKYENGRNRVLLQKMYGSLWFLTGWTVCFRLSNSWLEILLVRIKLIHGWYLYYQPWVDFS